MVWDKVTWSIEHRPVMYSKTLLSWRGRRIDLHKIVGEDGEGMFHSHPARAIRIILRYSYYEQLLDGTIKKWKAGMIGVVNPELTHRIHRVGEPCYTLWIRGRTTQKVRLFGYGQES